MPKDTAKGLKYYTLAADQGQAGAAFNLGVIYDYGQGVLKDRTKAIKYYTVAALAAHQGNSYAQTNLGHIYLRGEGAAKDYGKAWKFYKLAADQGDAEGQYRISQMLMLGMGVVDRVFDTTTPPQIITFSVPKQANLCSFQKQQ